MFEPAGFKDTGDLDEIKLRTKKNGGFAILLRSQRVHESYEHSIFKRLYDKAEAQRNWSFLFNLNSNVTSG